jgi:hypothetical protein
VARLVEVELDPAGEGDGRQQAQFWSLIGRATSIPLGLEGGHGGGDVVAELG